MKKIKHIRAQSSASMGVTSQFCITERTIKIVNSLKLPCVLSVLEFLRWTLFHTRFSSSELLSSSLYFLDILTLLLRTKRVSTGRIYLGMLLKNHAPDFFHISLVSAHIRHNQYSLELLHGKTTGRNGNISQLSTNLGAKFIQRSNNYFREKFSHILWG